MPCYSPLMGWRSKHASKSGKYPITFRKSEAQTDKEMTVPCGQCIGCRIDYSRQWAIRCMHEAEGHEFNSFVTLTYDEKKIPLLSNGEPTLSKEDVVKFLKRLRKKFSDVKIKHFGCGEYGDENLRPHYHLCLFGIDFKDKQLWKENVHGDLYVSEILNRLWSDPKDGEPFGFATVGQVTFQSAAYTARYCMKKFKGKDAMSHYERMDPMTGEVIYKQPEFATMSRGGRSKDGGIGKNFIDKWKSEIVKHDTVILNGSETKVPKYYDNQIEKTYPDKLEENKKKRLEKVKDALIENSLARLHVKGIIKKSQIQQLKKEL